MKIQKQANKGTTKDKVFFGLSYLLIILVFVFPPSYLWLVGVPWIIVGIYCFVLGKGYLTFIIMPRYFQGKYARILGVLHIIYGITLSIVIYLILKNF